MPKYMLTWKVNVPGDYKAIEKEKPNKEQFLASIPESVLDHEFTIYEVTEKVTKETLVHGGNYDHVLPE